MIAISLNSEKKEYSRALEIIDQYLSNPKFADIFGGLYLIEKGKSLYGLRQFDEAILCLDKVETPSTTHHPFDLSLYYVRDSYKALCHFELGAVEEALQSIKRAVDHFESLPHTLFKDFTFDAYNKIRAKIS